MRLVFAFIVLLISLHSTSAFAQCGFNAVNDFVCPDGPGARPANPFKPPRPLADSPPFPRGIRPLGDPPALPRSAVPPPPAFRPAQPSAPAGPAPQCSTDWQGVASDNLGWYRNGDGHGAAKNRFSIGTAPDGSTAVQHTIRKNDVVTPLGYDSPVFKPKPGYKGVILSYEMWIESGKGRNQPSKYMSLMGGRGQAGGAYQNKAGTGDEGWSHYLTANQLNRAKAAVGSANRSALGAPCDNHMKHPGGDPIGGNKQRCFEKNYGYESAFATGRWVKIEIVTIMNDKGQANGQAYFSIDGKQSDVLNNVMWAIDPEESPELWIRWRHMFGGNPEKLPPSYDMKEWYKGFSLSVCY